MRYLLQSCHVLFQDLILLPQLTNYLCFLRVLGETNQHIYELI